MVLLSLFFGYSNPARINTKGLMVLSTRVDVLFLMIKPTLADYSFLILGMPSP
jgi:hypothetical protein